MNPAQLPDRPHSRSTSRGTLHCLLDSATSFMARFWFPGSTSYWETRYRLKGSSGKGSYGRSARFKAEYINAFVTTNGITTAVEYGCGDGAQLALLSIPTYIGVDVSSSAVARCRQKYAHDPSKSFHLLRAFKAPTADLVLSLDVIYHLVEDNVFESYMARLFQAQPPYVVIYSTDHEQGKSTGSRHVRHRHVSRYCFEYFPNYRLVERTDPFPGSGSLGPRFLQYVRQ